MQTSIADRAPGFPGLLVDTRDHNIETGVSTEASAEIPFGVMVKRGAADGDVQLLTATNNVLAGIVVHQDGLQRDVQIGSTGIKPGVSLGVLQQGCIWVYSETAVNPTTAVRVRAVAAGAEVPGQFRATADTTDTVDISAFARWRSTTAGAGIAQLEIDMNGAAGAVADT